MTEPKRVDTIASLILEARAAPPTMLDVVDQLLTSGVVADGDIMMGLAGVDLIYLRLSALLCAADRVLPHGRAPFSRHSGTGALPRRSAASRTRRRRRQPVKTRA